MLTICQENEEVKAIQIYQNDLRAFETESWIPEFCGTETSPMNKVKLICSKCHLEQGFFVRGDSDIEILHTRRTPLFDSRKNHPVWSNKI